MIPSVAFAVATAMAVELCRDFSVMAAVLEGFKLIETAGLNASDESYCVMAATNHISRKKERERKKERKKERKNERKMKKEMKKERDFECDGPIRQRWK